MHHFPKNTRAGALVRLSADVDLSPYGMLRMGSTGVVQHFDDDVLTIKLDKAVKGFGDRLELMADSDDVLDVLTFRRRYVPAFLREPLRLAAAFLLVAFIWEAMVEPTVALATTYLPDIDPITIIISDLSGYF